MATFSLNQEISGVGLPVAGHSSETVVPIAGPRDLNELWSSVKVGCPVNMHTMILRSTKYAVRIQYIGKLNGMRYGTLKIRGYEA